MSTLPDEFLHALLLLSLFPGSFERRAAAELLGMTSIALSKTRSLLRILATCNLLQYSSQSERYIMHASVRACCRSLAQELGLTYESARSTFRPYRTVSVSHKSLLTIKTAKKEKVARCHNRASVPEVSPGILIHLALHTWINLNTFSAVSAI